MFDVIIYETDGRRHLYDHVSQVTNISDNVVIDFITDLGDQYAKTIDKKQIAYIRMVVT